MKQKHVDHEILRRDQQPSSIHPHTRYTEEWGTHDDELSPSPWPSCNALPLPYLPHDGTRDSRRHSRTRQNLVASLRGLELEQVSVTQVPSMTSLSHGQDWSFAEANETCPKASDVSRTSKYIS